MLEKLDPVPRGRAEDLTGQKFRHLTVLYRVANRQERPTWQCQCDCGNYFTAIARDLKNGRTVSCGCKTNEGKIIDRTGQQFGELTVLGMYKERASNGDILWNCQCSCGNIIQIRTGNLINQKTCGKCFHGKDISGQRFGKLVALNYDHTSPSKKSIWKCQCDCGSISFVNITDLIYGKTQSCGCTKSRGEEKIAQILQNNGLSFEKQKTFPDCIFEDSNYPALFDFWVENSYIVEYDGIQHFEATGGWNTIDQVKDTQKRDKYKNQWCLKHNIPIIRIPYTSLEKITLEDLKPSSSKFIVDDGAAAWEN